MSAINLSIETLEDTQQLAVTIAGIADGGDTILLSGDLGTGKTSFAQFFIRALTGKDVEVTSPTFNLVQPYTAYIDGKEIQLMHYDLYRLESPAALAEIGLEDANDAIRIIEWPERMGTGIRLDSWLHIHFTLEKNGARHVTIRADGAIAAALREDG